MPNFTVTRRGLLTTAAASLLPPTVHAQARGPAASFVLIGDWGRAGAEKQREVGVQMGRTAEAIGSQFVISVGDNFYEDGVTGLADPQWRDSFEAIYSAPSLQTPWYVILGNHDYRGDIQAQLDYSNRSMRWRLPARYFSRSERLGDGTTIEFFYIDTSPFVAEYRGTKVRIDDQDTTAQLKWLDTALGTSTAKWKIVIGHHPIYTVIGGKRNTRELIAQIEPLLQKHQVRIYINGHDHNLQYLQRNNIHYITNGAGSEVYEPGPAKPGQFASGHHGFMTANLSADRFQFSLIDDGGSALYTGEVLA